MKKRFLINIMTVAFIVLLVTAGVYLWWRWSQTLLAQKPYETEREEVAYYIERHYLLDDTIQAESLLQQYPTAEAMVQALQDPYSELLLQEELTADVEELNGSYVGVGFEAKKQVGAYLQILHITKESPALAAGLRPNDLIVRIEEHDTKAMTSEETLSWIKGQEGTTVQMTVQREGKTFEVELERAKLETSVIEYRMLSERTGYLSLSQIPLLVHREIGAALTELSEQGMQSLILDLRGNGGGEIEEAEKIASLLVPEQVRTLFTVTHKTKAPDIYERTGKQLFAGQVYILVNRDTASSAELLADVLRNTADAVLIGETTFGKGISQAFFYLESGNILKLTTGRFRAEGGAEINGNGVLPDYQVPMGLQEKQDDIPLQTALELAAGHWTNRRIGRVGEN